MADYHIPLVPDHIYHVSNRSVGSEKIFIEERNYIFFLKKAMLHINPIADIFAYSLVPNHFHFLLEIHSLDVIEAYYSEIKKKALEADLICDFIMERFSNFLNSYTKAFNKTYGRAGGMFIDFLKREEIEDKLQFLNAAVYIHQDPIKHGHCASLKGWNWTSYNFDFFEKRNDLLEKFGGLQRFTELHEKPIGNRLQLLELA